MASSGDWVNGEMRVMEVLLIRLKSNSGVKQSESEQSEGDPV